MMASSGKFPKPLAQLFGLFPSMFLTLFESGIFVASNTGYLTYGQHDLTSQDYAWRDHVTHTRSNTFGGW